ncbi:hypothetical protein Droror1_Dr00018903 [Drosera rotundifolia]
MPMGIGEVKVAIAFALPFSDRESTILSDSVIMHWEKAKGIARLHRVFFVYREMGLGYKKLWKIMHVLPRLLPGAQNREYRQASILSSLTRVPVPLACSKMYKTTTGSCIERFSSIAELPQEDPYVSDLMSFIKFAFNEPKGCHHCWLNRGVDGMEALRKEGIFLVLIDTSVDKSSVLGRGAFLMLEKAKLLQQRFPWVNVFALQSSSDVRSSTYKHLLVDFLLKEYIAFPILLTDRTFQEVSNGACYLLFRGLSSPPIYLERDIDLVILHKALKELNGVSDKNLADVDRLMSSWSKKPDFVKQPYGSHSLQGLLLQFPACISVDMDGNRFFLSDCNQHRIIVFDGDGKIMDVIGSSPGFEDGEFETAKLTRPAASYYDASADCLYILDSENHAVRRAYMGTRVMETVHLSPKDKGRNGLWAWFVDKLGMKKNDALPSEEFDSDTLMLPWYLLKSDDDLLILNRSMDTLWTLDLDREVVKNIVKGSAEIMVACGQKISDRVSTLQRLPPDFLQHIATSTHSLDGIPYSGLVSSFVTCGSRLLVCDAASQRVVVFSEQDQNISNLQLSNFGTLGLPYWLPSSLEKAYCMDTHGEAHIDHLQSFKLLPGRIGIRLNVAIPSSTVLIEPAQEECIWRQVRGAALEVSRVESVGESTEKVGMAQQWYDDLDNLVFEVVSEIPTSTEDCIAARDLEDDKVCIDCAVNTSPGTSEVIIYAAIYLKLKTAFDACYGDQEKKAAIIADILNSERWGKAERNEFVNFLAKSKGNLEELVFVKPLHVRIQLNTLNHPKADNGKDFILTDTDVDVNVTL